MTVFLPSSSIFHVYEGTHRNPLDAHDLWFRIAVDAANPLRTISDHPLRAPDEGHGKTLDRARPANSC